MVVAILVFLLVAAPMLVCTYQFKWGLEPAVVSGGDRTVIALGGLCQGENCRPALMFHGSVSAPSMAKLLATLDAHPEVKAVCLASPGGQGEYARVAARAFKTYGINTCVAPRLLEDGRKVVTVCGSACSYLWLGGSQRLLAARGAEVGFHQTFMGEGLCCTLNNAIQATKTRYAVWSDGRELGDAEARMALYRKGANCGPSQFYALRQQEAVQLGLVSPSEQRNDWYWKADDPAIAFPPLPQAEPCAG